MPTQYSADHIPKTRLVIRGMLALLKKRSRRENLADNKYYESAGKSITGIRS